MAGENSRQTIGNLIRDTRIRLDLTQREVYDRCGMAHTTYQRIENGSANVRERSLIKAAETLGVPGQLVSAALSDDRPEALNALIDAVQALGRSKRAGHPASAVAQWSADESDDAPTTSSDQPRRLIDFHDDELLAEVHRRLRTRMHTVNTLLGEGGAERQHAAYPLPLDRRGEPPDDNP